MWLFVLLTLYFLWLVIRKPATRNGYKLTSSMFGSPRFEHRVVAEYILGRDLEHWEVVHHINGRRMDNRPENLCVMSSTNHERYHGWYDWIYQKYGNYPRRETQLRKLREDFGGNLLGRK